MKNPNDGKVSWVKEEGHKCESTNLKPQMGDKKRNLVQ